MTECDADGFFAALLDELNAELKPVGLVEQLLVDKLAVTYLRMRRCAEAESLHFRSHWKFNPANFGKFPHNETVVTLGLYDARLMKQFLRLLHEIGQRQKARTAQGDHPHGSAVPPLSISQIPQIRSNDGQEDEQPRSEHSSQNTELDSCVRADDVRGAGYQPATRVELQSEAAVLPELKNEPNSPHAALHRNDESQARSPVPQELKNEPNFPPRADSPRYEPPGQPDAANMKNEPNSADGEGAGANLASRPLTGRQVGPGEVEVKDEPNAGYRG